MFIRGSAQLINKKYDSPIVAVEIGVRQGNNALAMLQEMNIKALFLVDPFSPYDDGGSYQDERTQRKNMLAMFDRLAQHREKIVWLFQKSETAAQLFPDQYFDYVYIDGDHSYESVKKDLGSWYRKIKPDGVMAGHDYGCLVAWPDVTKAVDEFIREKDLTVIRCGDSDWYFEDRKQTKS